MNRPQVVSAQEWQAARDALLVKEKQHTRALDALAAERRRMPMVRLDKDYRFTAPDGTTVGLADLFQDRRQLVIYHFMLEPGQDWTCGGCASFTDNIADQSHLNARDTTLILLARVPQEEIDPVRRRMGWTVPWSVTQRRPRRGWRRLRAAGGMGGLAGGLAADADDAVDSAAR